jgi:hypothetical protein
LTASAATMAAATPAFMSHAPRPVEATVYEFSGEGRERPRRRVAFGDDVGVARSISVLYLVGSKPRPVPVGDDVGATRRGLLDRDRETTCPQNVGHKPRGLTFAAAAARLEHAPNPHKLPGQRDGPFAVDRGGGFSGKLVQPHGWVTGRS